MRRKYVCIILLLGLALTSWIYWNWKSYSKFDDSIILKYEYLNTYSIEPNITTYKPFLVIIVTSNVKNVKLRNAHRRAMPAEELRNINVTRVFLLAQIPVKQKYVTQADINDENNTFGDILQGNFVESFRNLSYKHLMGLKWASTTYPESYYILKVDDDTVFNLERTYTFLKTVDYSVDFIMGYVIINTVPHRTKNSKYYVTWKEYPWAEYPPYLSNWYYITTPVIAAALCAEAVHHPLFWIDDIFVTGLLTEARNIELRQLPDKWVLNSKYFKCCLDDMIQKSIMCDYVVGRKGKNNNLIVEFNEAVRKCNNWANCTKRSLDNDLKNTCVA